MTVAYQHQAPDGTWLLDGYECDFQPATPRVTPLLVRQEVVKLVPHLSVLAAPGNGTTLVNIQTILWLDTPADRDLGTVTLLGHEVAITIHVQGVAWEFGDGESATSTGPGRPFTDRDYCDTPQCPGFFGHTYTRTGEFTISARVTWSARYTVDGGAPQAVDGTVAGPIDQLPVTVRQARGVLVAPPGSD